MATTTDTLVTELILDAKKYQQGATAATAATSKLKQDIGGLNGAIHGAVDGNNDFAHSIRFATAELDSSTPIVSEVVSVLKALAIAAVGVGVALSGLGIMAMRQAAEFEASKMALQVYLGTIEAVDNQIRRLIEVARLPGLGFTEAIEGSVRLMAAGMNARLAERALLAFGNALASAGGGKAELDGVILALTQIASKAQVSAEEINQIAERVPQIRQIMLQAFGTANTEALAKMGVAPRDFIKRIIDELEKLPKAQASAKNAFENISDGIKRAFIQVGDVLNTYLVPALDKLGNFLDFLTTQNAFASILESWIGSIKLLGHETQKWLQTLGKARTEFGQIFGFLGESDGFGDFLIRAASIFVSVMENLPEIIRRAVEMVMQMAERIRGFVNGIIDLINAVLDNLLGKGLEIKILGRKWGQIGGGGAFQKIEHVGFDSSVNPFQGMGEGITAGAQKWYDAFQKFVPSNDVADDPSKGDFLGYQQEIAANTASTAASLERMLDLRKSAFGGGDIGQQGVTVTEMNRIRSGGGGRNEVKIYDAPSYIHEQIQRFALNAGLMGQ